MERTPEAALHQRAQQIVRTRPLQPPQGAAQDDIRMTGRRNIIVATAAETWHHGSSTPKSTVPFSWIPGWFPPSSYYPVFLSFRYPRMAHGFIYGSCQPAWNSSCRTGTYCTNLRHRCIGSVMLRRSWYCYFATCKYCTSQNVMMMTEQEHDHRGTTTTMAASVCNRRPTEKKAPPWTVATVDPPSVRNVPSPRKCGREHSRPVMTP